MKILTYVIAGIAVFVVLVIAMAVSMSGMEQDCAAKNGTFIKAADPIMSMCIIPPK